MIVVEVKNRYAGFYTLRKGKVDADGVPIPGTEKQVAAFKNLITDNGLDKIWSCPGGSFGIQYLCTACRVGTGNTAPAFTDTQLDVDIAGVSSNESQTKGFTDDLTEPFWYFIKTYRFNAGTATGNLAEVGTGWGATNLFSRALILDGGGSPTTITVLADEYLDVTFECRNYISVVDGTGTITVSSVSYDVTWRGTGIASTPNPHLAISDSNSFPSMIAFESDTLGTVYTSISGTGSGGSEAAVGSYVSGNYYMDIKGTWGLTAGNFGTGIGGLLFTGNQFKFQMNFTPKIPKTSDDILTLTLRVSWARFTPTP